MHDPELERLYRELKGLKSKEDKRAEQKATEKLDANFILNLGKKKITNKDQTLGEYLEQFKTIDKRIEKENKNREDKNSDLNALLDFINSDSTATASNTAWAADEKQDPMKQNIFIQGNKSLNENIEQAHDQNTQQSKFISKGKSGIFTSIKNEVRQSNKNRISTYSNTDARVINDNDVSPLKLVQYTTKF